MGIPATQGQTIKLTDFSCQTDSFAWWLKGVHRSSKSAETNY